MPVDLVDGVAPEYIEASAKALSGTGELIDDEVPIGRLLGLEPRGRRRPVGAIIPLHARDTSQEEVAVDVRQPGPRQSDGLPRL